jgi:capsular polysaccharide biosynthesis protein
MASVVERIGKTSAEVMYQRGRAAGATKRKEELQSDQRLAQMWERDNLREARLAQARAQQAQKDKQLANIIVAILALVIVGSVILFILAQWGG